MTTWMQGKLGSVIELANIFSCNYFFKKLRIYNSVYAKRFSSLQKLNFCTLTLVLIFFAVTNGGGKYVWENLRHTNTFGLNSSMIQLWGRNRDSLVKNRGEKMIWEVTKHIFGAIKVELERIKWLNSARVPKERETARKILMAKPGNI